jgi:hypothetical protein
VTHHQVRGRRHPFHDVLFMHPLVQFVITLKGQSLCHDDFAHPTCLVRNLLNNLQGFCQIQFLQLGFGDRTSHLALGSLLRHKSHGHCRTGAREHEQHETDLSASLVLVVLFP